MSHKTKSARNGGKRRNAVKTKEEAADSKNSPSRRSSRPAKSTSERQKSKKKLKEKTADHQPLASRRDTEETEVGNVKKLVVRIGKNEKTVADQHLAVSIPSSDFSEETSGKSSEGLQNVFGDAMNVEGADVSNIKNLVVSIHENEKIIADKHLLSSVPSSAISRKTSSKGSPNIKGDDMNVEGTKSTNARKLVVHIRKNEKNVADKHLRDYIPSSTISRKRSGKGSDALPIVMEDVNTQSDTVTVAPPVNLRDTTANRDTSTSNSSSSLYLSPVKISGGKDDAILNSTPVAADADLKRKSPSMSPIKFSKPDQKKFKGMSPEQSSNNESTTYTTENNTELDSEWDKIVPNEKYNSPRNIDSGSEWDGTTTRNTYSIMDSCIIDPERDNTITNTRCITFSSSDNSDSERKNTMTYSSASNSTNEDDWISRSIVSENTYAEPSYTYTENEETNFENRTISSDGVKEEYTESKESSFENTSNSNNEDQKEPVKISGGKDDAILNSTPVAADADLKRKSPSMSPIKFSKPDQKKFKGVSPEQSSNNESTTYSIKDSCIIDPERDNTITNTRCITFSSSDNSDSERKNTMTYSSASNSTNEDDWILRSIVSENTYTENEETNFENRTISSDGVKEEYTESKESSFENTSNSNNEDQKEYTKNKELISENTSISSHEDQKENLKTDRKETELLTSTPISNLVHKIKKESPPMSPI